MTIGAHQLTTAYVLRHLPHGSGLDAGIAALDIAQDLILADLHGAGLLGDLVVSKGGTALRKLFAGTRGRFSTDLDFALADADGDPSAAGSLVAEQIAGMTHRSFRYEVGETRDRWTVQVSCDLVTHAALPPLKLDVGPPCWLRPAHLPFLEQPVHKRYGSALPRLPVMPLPEILAEKIARLTRLSTARDAWDLVWAASTSPHSDIDRDLVRRLGVLKVWVDNNGIDGHWRPAIGAQPFAPDAWLRTGRTWDDEQIGLLTDPPPRLADLEQELRRLYGWLTDLDEVETRFALADQRHLADVVQAIGALPGGALTTDDLWARWG